MAAFLSFRPYLPQHVTAHQQSHFQRCLEELAPGQSLTLLKPCSSGYWTTMLFNPDPTLCAWLCYCLSGGCPSCTKCSLCHNRMGPALHLRLLLVLCNDVASGGALRAEFQARIDEATQLSTQHRQLLIEVSCNCTQPFHGCKHVTHHCAMRAVHLS